MGSMLKADSDRRELMRERRQARIERKQQRRDARERKRAHISDAPTAMSPMQRAGQEQVDAAVDRIVSAALEHHDQIAATASATNPANATPPATHAADARARTEWPTGLRRASSGSESTGEQASGGAHDHAMAAVKPTVGGSDRRPRRERDMAAFRERRRDAVDEARREARERIARAGEPASVADALAALAHPGARPWDTERQQLERALQSGRIVEVGASARKALWSISRDAARNSRRAKRDPELALAACVAYAIIVRLPRTALRSAQRARPTPPDRTARRRAFWR